MKNIIASKGNSQWFSFFSFLYGLRTVGDFGLCWFVDTVHFVLSCTRGERLRVKGEGVSNLDQAWLCNWTLTLSGCLQPINERFLCYDLPQLTCPFCAMVCFVFYLHSHTRTHTHTHQYAKTEKKTYIGIGSSLFSFFSSSFQCLFGWAQRSCKKMADKKPNWTTELFRSVQQTNWLCAFTLSPPMSYVDSISCRKHDTLCFCRCWYRCWNKTKCRTKRRVD